MAWADENVIDVPDHFYGCPGGEEELDVAYMLLETDKALFLGILDGGEVFRKWIPKSVGEYKGDLLGGSLWVPGWFYEKMWEEDE